MNAMERWLAPGILIGVALLQLGLANFGTLTPWKGGGFGMFSSTDSLGKRVVSCEGVTTSGEKIRINPFAGLEPELVDSWQSMPREDVLRRLAGDLLRTPVVPAGSRRNAAAERFLVENPALVPEIEPVHSKPSAVFRPISSEDPEAALVDAVDLESVRMQWWRVVFDVETASFTSEPIGEFVELSRND
ncbi:MAG: hypothetical protein ACI8UO_002569 [Verrucomicrobiales bacterium]|jgi:hypothetical protein